MSKRLQVLIPDQEMAEIQAEADREHVPVGEWVRRTLREARQQKSAIEPETKLRAIRDAVRYEFPAPDIGEMNREIERGYLEGADEN